MDDRHPRVLFLGMSGPFTHAPLAALLAAGRTVVALVVPAREGQAEPFRRLPPDPPVSELPLLTPYIGADPIHLAWAQGIPVYTVRDLGAAQTQEQIAGLRADVACVACFPRRIPPSLLSLPSHGFLNLHPSLLPAYRGPYPLFWTFRDGVRATGVTLHFMDEGLDSGDIALQEPLTVPHGISGPAADRLAGRLGGTLLVEATARLANGTLPRHPQPTGGRYYPSPGADDFRLERGWSAQRAFNFMRGTAEWGHPYLLETAGGQVRLATAIACYPGRRLQTAGQQEGREIWLQFSPGVLHARLS